jgi:hypothetical protein
VNKTAKIGELFEKVGRKAKKTKESLKTKPCRLGSVGLSMAFLAFRIS